MPIVIETFVNLLFFIFLSFFFFFVFFVLPLDNVRRAEARLRSRQGSLTPVDYANTQSER